MLLRRRGEKVMSYFIGGCSAGVERIERFEKILSSVVPSNKRDATYRVRGTIAFLTIFGGQKVIPDLCVTDQSSGSWIAVFGTPLMQFKSEKERLGFLKNFKSRPRDILRNEVDGNCAVICFDSEQEALITATDFNSTTPIFFSRTANGLFVASNELALAKCLKAKVDPYGFSQGIHMGSTWERRTRFEGISKMLPCEFAVFRGNEEPIFESYWGPHEEAIWKGSFEELAERWMSELKRSVRSYFDCSGRRRVFSDFTGGEDARLLLASCHSLGIPFKGQVAGSSEDTDVTIAKRAARLAKFELLVREKHWITEDKLLVDALRVILNCDGYIEFFKACADYATDQGHAFDDYENVKLCGIPGGVAFRGEYYLRAKAFWPSRTSKLDSRSFTRLKFLLDYHPGLLRFPDHTFLDEVYNTIDRKLLEVKGFPMGIQVDHLLRSCQTALLGLKYKNPLYLPYATRELTRSIYFIPPAYKNWGRLTRACTEMLFPELAVVKTQKGVPTIHFSWSRLPQFVPEYLAILKSVSGGTISRYFKWGQANKWYYSLDQNAYIFKALLNGEPYRNWFESASTMLTGEMYQARRLEAILGQARRGVCRYVPILGRIISLELACRWVYD